MTSAGERTLSRPEPTVRLAAWPHAKRFGLFLSHDIDQIYDREIFKLLGDLNRVRRLLRSGQMGPFRQCIGHIARSLVRPKPAGRDVDRILEIEARHGVRSTFFFLEDRVFSRHGGRYCYDDAAARHIVRRVVDAGCDVGVHGAYHAFNDAAAYRRQRASLQGVAGFEPCGIRNHYLRHDGVTTWEAQHEAGFSYDATFGANDDVGIPRGRARPFAPLASVPEFVVLPLTIMDSALFGALGLCHREAVRRCRDVAGIIRDETGLLTLSWHNNHFAEPEFADWEQTYDELLDWVVDRDPWCGTGAEIAAWWRARAEVQVDTRPHAEGGWLVELRSGNLLEGLTLDVNVHAETVRGNESTLVRAVGSGTQVLLPRLNGSGELRILPAPRPQP